MTVKKPAEVEEIRRLVSHSAIREIDIDKLNIDRSYQRPLNLIHRYIYKHFMPEAFHDITVAEREDGTLWVVDGQQRLEAYKLMGKTRIRCRVIASSGPKKEAEVYVEMNRRRAGMKSVDIFKGLVAKEDSLALLVVEIAKRHSFKVPLCSLKAGSSDEVKATNLTCHGTLMQVMERREKESGGYTPGSGDLLSDTLKIVAACWLDVDAKRTHADLVAGIANWLTRRCGNFDLERVVKKFKARFQRAEKAIHYATTGNGDRANNLADKLESVYTGKKMTQA